MIKTVGVNDLQIDDSYQRSLNGVSVKKMAKEFNTNLLALPLVGVRSDGSMWVIDGQHRVAAAKLASVPTIDVRLVSGLSTAQEAQMFVDANINTRRLTGANFFWASYRAENPQILAIALAYEQNGYTIHQNRHTATRATASGKLAIKPSNTMITVFSKDPEANEAGIRCLTRAYPAINGIRNVAVCKELQKITLIAGVTQAISAWQTAGVWDEKAEQDVSETIGSAVPSYWTAIGIDRRLGDLSANQNVMIPASIALWIAKAVAKQGRRYKLEPTQVWKLTVGSESFARALNAG